MLSSPARDLPSRQNAERGNVLFVVLLAVGLIGILTAVIMGSGGGDGGDIDKETLLIRITEAQRFAAEAQRGVSNVLGGGVSESALRFAAVNAPSDYGDIDADPDKSDQVFDPAGGGIVYKQPPAGVNNGDPWEFYGHTAIPGAGTSAPDLIAVLPNVSQQFCSKINQMAGQDAPADPSPSGTASCVYGGAGVRFSNGVQFTTGGAVNTMDEGSFAQDDQTGAARVAPQACVMCSGSATGHYYYLLLAR